VQPTQAGRTAKVQAVAILDEQQSRFLAPLTPAEQRQLGDLLKRLQQPPGPDA
jgi:DNA-binding MarR family transcriptional regulator